MRIAIDGHVLGKNIGGVERFVRELVKQLPSVASQHEYDVFVTKQEYARLMQAGQPQPSVRYIPYLSSNPLIQRLLLLPLMVRRYEIQALLVQRLSPWACGDCKLIATIHDLTPIKFADAYQGFSNTLVRLLTRNTIRRADLILTPTQVIADEIQSYCPEVKAPIKAFYNGVDVSAFGRSKVDESAQENPSTKNKAVQWLTVGAIERRKNIETILQALQKTDVNTELTIIGKVRDYTYANHLIDMVDSLGLSQRVHWLGFAEETALIKHYQQADFFITASLDEGFNIPPLEAMACGTKVMCSRIPVHEELFTGAVQFFEPMNVQSLLDGVMTLTENPSLVTALVAGGDAKVSQFNWTQTALNVALALKAIES